MICLLSDTDSWTSGLAADSLLRATCRIVGPTGRRRPSPRVRLALDAALTGCMAQFDQHRRVEGLVAALLAASGATGPLEQALADADSPGMFAARGLFRRAEHPLVRRNLVRWLSIPSLESAAASAVEGLRATSDLAAVLEQGHLLRSPQRRRALKRRRGKWQPPDVERMAGSSAAAQRGMVELSAIMEQPERDRARRLGGAIGLPDPVARLRALRILAAMRSPDAEAQVRSFLFDPHPSVAHAALREIAQREPPGRIDQGLAERLSRSPHDTLRIWAMATQAAASPAGFATHWHSLPFAVRIGAARLLLRQSRAKFTSALRHAFGRAAGPDRADLVVLIRRLGLSADFEQDLVLAASSGDAREASAAVAALAEVVSPAAEDALRVALRNPDARTAANAVEAIGRRPESANLALIEPMIRVRNARVRANALVALIRQGRADEACLSAMLADPDPRHQRSARWAASRIGLAACSPHAAEK